MQGYLFCVIHDIDNVLKYKKQIHQVIYNLMTLPFLCDHFSHLTLYYGNNQDTLIARFWPANASLYYGVCLPIILIFITSLIYSILLFLKLRSNQISNLGQIIIEFRNILIILVYLSFTFAFGFISGELGNATGRKHQGTGFFVTFVTFKWLFMFILIWVSIFNRNSMKMMLERYLCLKRNNKINFVAEE